MDDELPLSPYKAKITYWICSLACLIIMFPSPLYQCQGSLQQAFSGDADHAVSLSGDQQTNPFRTNHVISRRVAKRERLFLPIIQRAADRYEIDPALVKAIIMVESSYNPKAVSRKGAEGLMQLMPGTARALGVEDSFDPELNVDAGVRYLKDLINRFGGDMTLAIAAYNAGLRKVKKHDGIPPYKATRSYVKKVFEYYRYYKEAVVTGINKV